MYQTNHMLLTVHHCSYCPSVFILKPGQLVHINKGRLHAFRKLVPAALPSTDCHAKLRSNLLSDLDLDDPRKYPAEFRCLSVAWDWMYRGVTEEGINREAVATLECAILNRQRKLQSLAIPGKYENCCFALLFLTTLT